MYHNILTENSEFVFMKVSTFYSAQ